MSVPNQCFALGRRTVSRMLQALALYGSTLVNKRGTAPIRQKITISPAAMMNRGSRRSLRQTSPHRVAARSSPPSGSAPPGTWVSASSGTASVACPSRLSIADPRIDRGAEDVDHEVREDEDHRRERDEPHDERPVLLPDADDQHLAEPRQVEDRLGDRRTAHQS